MRRKLYNNTKWNTTISSAGFRQSSGVPLRSDDCVFQENCPRRSTSLPTGGELKTSHSRKRRCCAAASGSTDMALTPYTGSSCIQWCLMSHREAVMVTFLISCLSTRLLVYSCLIKCFPLSSIHFIYYYHLLIFPPSTIRVLKLKQSLLPLTGMKFSL